METYQIKTGKKPTSISFVLTTNGMEVPVYLVGYDPLAQNTLYFRSRFLIKNKETININCPQTPIKLNILIFSDKNLPYQVAAIKADYLSIRKISDPAIQFIEKFSRRAGRLRTGTYKFKGAPFTIDLKRAIYRDNGDIHPTPSRIHVSLPIIQVSKIKFDKMSVPERVAILLHEYAHNYINQDPEDEHESDWNGLMIYKDLGYPNIESFNAFANIMADSDINYSRMKRIMNFM